MCNTCNLNPNQLVACGEDPADPGGYFIIKGLEYMIMYLEKLDLNKFILFTNRKEKNDIDVSITTLNESRKTNIQLIFYSQTSKLVMVNLPSLNVQGGNRSNSSVNIFHISRILKMPDDTFERLISTYFQSADPLVQRKLLDMLCVNKANISVNPDSVEVIGNMLHNAVNMTRVQKEAAVLKKVLDDVFAHLSYYFTDIQIAHEATKVRNVTRINMLAMCTAMILERLDGRRSDSDRDSWSNKRIEASSKAMEHLLRNAWACILDRVSKAAKDVTELSVKEDGLCPQRYAHHRQLHFVFQHLKVGSQEQADDEDRQGSILCAGQCHLRSRHARPGAGVHVQD